MSVEKLEAENKALKNDLLWAMHTFAILAWPKSIGDLFEFMGVPSKTAEYEHVQQHWWPSGDEEYPGDSRVASGAMISAGFDPERLQRAFQENGWAIHVWDKGATSLSHNWSEVKEAYDKAG